MEGKETKLSITKEQAEAFEKWKDDYFKLNSLVKAVLRQELGAKKYESCELCTAINNMQRKITTLTITEGEARFDGVQIESEWEFGFAISSYMTSIEKAFFEDNATVEDALSDQLVKSPCKQLEEIFFGK